MDKNQIAEIFEEIATLLELKAENPFRIRAYRNAARALLNLEEDLEKVVREERLTELEGIGKDLAGKITLLVTKGKLPDYEKLKKSIPSGLLEMMQVHGLGGKKVKVLYEKLGIKSISALKKACLDGEIAKISGFGKKTQQNILDSLSHKESYGKRHLWWDAMEIATPLIEGLKKLKSVKKAEIAGSIRRKLETIGDVDILVASDRPKEIMDWFTKQASVEKILSKGEAKSSVLLKEDMQTDLLVVPEKQFGFALCYFTGSKEHSVKLRQLANKQGWTLNEWGLSLINSKKAPPKISVKKAATEEDIYKALGLSYIPPELRENMGEFEAAAKGKIPKLIEEKDIRGTFHNHTTASDGRSTLKEMIAAAEKLKWEYIGISDHSKSSFQANGQSEEQLMHQVQEIKKINLSKKFKTHVFSGIECDILANGNLDFPNEILKALDFVIVSVHNAFSQDEKTMTRRIIKAIENPYTTMLGHLTGRLLLRREAYKVNIPKVIDACIANRKIIELNGNPNRLDMDWRYWHAASEKGLLCCINTDSHLADHLHFITAGVNAARKGWLEKKHVLNTRSLKEIQNYLK